MIQLDAHNLSDFRPTVRRVDELSEDERSLLLFEAQQWHHLGAKEDAVRRLFGLSITSYFQRLNVLVDRPAALRHDPLLVHRLLRLRATRRGHRTA